uniref:ACB domain-containing protein n=1 Tax=Denticeps clupeoides TaxID=299321 RepID=A0AAY4AHY7_9TELE
SVLPTRLLPPLPSLLDKAEFEEHAEKVKTVKSRPADQELLDLYGLYKQATAGDIHTDEPGMLDLKGKAKWKAWDSRKGMSKDEAMAAYISLAKEIISKYGL